MKCQYFLLTFCCFLFLITAGCTDDQFPRFTGPYLGQVPPGDNPELFAPGIVTTGMYTRDLTMTPDGSEIYFCRVVGPYTYTAIMVTRIENGRWTRPEVAPFSANPRTMDLEPFISPDGQKFFFLSTRPDTANGESEGDQDIWVMDRTGDGWSEPYNLGAPVNSEGAEFFPSVTIDGTIYFSRAEKGSRIHHIYRSRYVDGKYMAPDKLPQAVNSGTNRYNAFIAPDESYIIVPVVGREDSHGFTDYYISYRSEDDEWSAPINLGDKINTPFNGEYSPYVSPDGQYFFFMSSRGFSESDQPERLTFSVLQKLYNEPRNGNADIYWIDASFIRQLKENQ